MIELPSDIERAFKATRQVAPRPGAERRIYRRLVAPVNPRPLTLIRIVLVPILLLLSGSLAYGFVGVVRRALVASTETRISVERISENTRARRSLARRAQALTSPPESSQTSPDHADPPSVDVQTPARAALPGDVAPRPAQSILPPAPLPPREPAIQRAALRSHETVAAKRLAADTSLPGSPTDTAARDGITSQATHVIGAESSPVPPTLQHQQPSATNTLSLLDLQLSDYQSALALSKTDAQAGLVRLREHRRRWPSSTLLHEVDLRIIQLLAAQGNREEARAEARRFLRRHPGSARIVEIRHIAGIASEGAPPTESRQ